MLSINWSDVWKMVESIKVPLIVIGVALALAIIVSLAVFKMGKPARKLTRSTAWVAAFIAVVVAVVSMLYGGFKTVLDLAVGTGALTDASKAQVEDLGNDISDEGMVLLKNQGGALPLAKGSAILALLGLEVVAIRRYRARKAEAVITVEPNASIDEAGAEKVDE